jgi:5-methylcytosine-specific restriction endonuclease McrA
MLNYYEQLQHPLWFKKRDEIILRDNNTCRVCGDKTHIHQVHHLCYLPDTHLWEYDDELMITTCLKDHQILNLILPKLSGLLAFKIITGDIDPQNINWLIDLLKHVKI